MRKILYAICIIAIVFSMTSCKKEPVQTDVGLQSKTAADSPHWQKIVAKNELKIGVPSTENSFYNELIDAFAKELDIPVTKISADGDFKKLLEDGTIDMYWGLYPKEAPDSFDFTFSTPYVTTTAVLLTLADNTEAADTKNNVIGVVKNSAEALLAAGKYENIKTYDSVKELWTALGYGNVNCIMMNNCDYESSDYFSSDKFRVQDTAMYNLVIAFKDGYTDLAAETDKTLAKIKASGVASEICEKWYGKDLISK